MSAENSCAKLLLLLSSVKPLYLYTVQQLQVSEVPGSDERFLGRVEVESLHGLVRKIVPVTVCHTEARHRVSVPAT